MLKIYNNKIKTLALISLSWLSGCAELPEIFEKVVYEPPPLRREYNELSSSEIDFIERYNSIIKDIRDFPLPGKGLEKYFHIFSNVNDLKDAQFILFAERHDHSPGQIWNLGALNMLMKESDTILFEGDQANKIVPRVSEHITSQIFAARQFELRKIANQYKNISISKIEKKFRNLFNSVKNFLALNELNFNKARGKYWDLTKGYGIQRTLWTRNNTMVATMHHCEMTAHLPNQKVFVIAGAFHLPHYEFAEGISRIDENKARAYFGTSDGGFRLSNDYYQFFADHERYGTTKSIYNFLKTRRYAVLIPKNLPNVNYYAEKGFFPREY